MHCQFQPEKLARIGHLCNSNDLCGFAAVKKKKLIKIFIHVQWVHQQILTKKFSF